MFFWICMVTDALTKEFAEIAGRRDRRSLRKGFGRNWQMPVTRYGEKRAKNSVNSLRKTGKRGIGYAGRPSLYIVDPEISHGIPRADAPPTIWQSDRGFHLPPGKTGTCFDCIRPSGCTIPKTFHAPASYVKTVENTGYDPS